MNKIISILVVVILTILCFLEIGFLSNYKEQLDHDTSARLFWWISLTIGLLTCILSFLKLPIRLGAGRVSNWLPIGSTVLLIVLLWPTLGAVLQKFPFASIDATQSDIIPQIQTMINWLFQGVFPYQPIIDWGYELFPTYLPLTWLPFVIPEVLSMDYRIFALLVFAAGLGVLTYHNQRSLLGVSLATLFVYYLILKIGRHEDTIIGYSVESMIAGFYLLFIASWKSRNKLMLGGALLLCLLSRYSLVVWLPVYFLYLWKTYDFTFGLRTGLIALAGIFLVYLLPFWFQDTSIYQRGMDHHAKAALNEWRGQPWQQDRSKPYTLYKGLGMASHYFEQTEVPLEDRLSKLQNTHLVLLLLSMLLFSTIIFWGHHYLSNPQLMLLGSFKCYLAIFYHFIQIPYSYLFLVLLVLNIPILIFMFPAKKMEALPGG